MARPKGTPNKRSQMLLRKLENEHKFHVANELIEIYGYNKKVLCNLVAKIQDNIDAGTPMLTGFTEDEVELYNMTNKECLSTLIRMLAYLYPKLKSMEVGTGSGDKVVFNINTLPTLAPAPDAVGEEAETVH